MAAAASTSPAVAKDGVLAWERWNPSGSLGEAISVSYVWDAQYGGVSFSKKEKTVLRVTGPKRGLYWRATTLDQFDSDRWLDNPIPLSTGLANGRLPNDPLLPTRSLDPSTWVKQEVEIGALRGPAHQARRSRSHSRSLGWAVFSISGRARARLQQPRARAAVHRLQLRAAP